jgi:hypothetical protein
MISFAAISAGCSELEVARLSSFPPNAPLVGALTYYLPRTVITVNGTVTLNNCDLKVSTGGERWELKATVALTPVTSFEPDPSHHYSIAYESSRRWMKELQIEVDNSPSGTLQSFNGTLNDQVGPTIVAAIGAAAQIGSAIGVAGVPIPGRAISHNFSTDLDLDGKKPDDYCADIRDALTQITAKQEIIDTAKDKPASKKDDLDIQNAAVQAAIARIDELKKQNKLVRSFTFRWVPRRTDQFKYHKAKYATPVLGRTSRSPVQGYWIAGRHISLVPIIKQWLTASGQQWLDEFPKGKGTTENDKMDPRPDLVAPYVVSLAFVDTSMGDPRQNENATPGGTNPVGLVIRDPAMGFLKICHQSDTNCDGGSAILLEDRPVETTTDVSRQSVSIAQFGRILILPQRSGLFENAVLTTGLNPDGTISKMSFHSSSTLLAGLGTLGTAANSVATGIAARNTAIGNVNTAQKTLSDAATAQVQAPGLYNKTLADCLANQATIINAGYTPMPCQ